VNMTNRTPSCSGQHALHGKVPTCDILEAVQNGRKKNIMAMMM
jgi:hypothetical protein